jgi:SAM-dependent methyltransferase
MPFDDRAFDCALLVTTLHHTYDPVQVMMEAARVADRLIIVEDVTHGQLHKWLTRGMDKLLNLEFFGTLHNNKSDGDWRNLFADLELYMVSSDQKWLFGAHWQRRSFGPIHQFIYVLERNGTAPSPNRRSIAPVAGD